MIAHRSPTTEPQWSTHANSKQALPSALRSIVLDPGSLTATLIALSDGNFNLRVINQQFGRAQPSEVKALGIHPRHRVWVREIVMSCGQCPWVYARSVLPLSSLKGPLRWLKTIGTKPLGALLFKDPSMRRGALELAKFRPELHPLPIPQSLPVWGRRSVFWLSNKPLLVSEIFLQSFPPTRVC